MNNQVNMQNQPGAPIPNTDTAGPKKRMVLWKKIALGVVIFFVVIFTLAFASTRSASDAAGNYISDLQAGNCSEIYSAGTSEFKESTTQTDWNEVCERISPILQGEPEERGVSVSSESGSDQIGEAEYLINGTDGKAYTVRVQMINRDSTWQFNAFDSNSN